MIVRSEVSPAAGSGPVVGDTSVRASQSSRAGHPATVHSLPAGAADELARTNPFHPDQPSPASEVPSSGKRHHTTPRDDPAAAHLARLVYEREPSLQDLLLERDPYPEFYTPLAVMLEAQVAVVVGEWNGRIPK